MTVSKFNDILNAALPAHITSAKLAIRVYIFMSACHPPKEFISNIEFDKSQYFTFPYKSRQQSA